MSNARRKTNWDEGLSAEASRAEELTKGLISCCLSHQAKRGGMAHPCDPRDLWGVGGCAAGGRFRDGLG